MTLKKFLVRAGLACRLAGTLGAADSTVAPGLNSFSAALYHQLATNGHGNLVFSPLSISSALSMALAGARGQTAAEIAKALGQRGADAHYHAELARLLQQIANTGNADGNQFRNANRLWLQKNFKILPDFGDTLQRAYAAPAVQLDFARDTEGARAEINSWTERETHEKIRNLFGPGVLNADTRLVLSSATWFLGKWEHAFRRSDTRPEPFQLIDGGKQEVDFMHQTGRFGYAETAAGQLLEMRYAGGGLAFDILLPEQSKPLDIDPGVLTGWLGKLQDRKVQVAVPKFRLESDFSLARTLAAVGMRSAFTSGADFSGIDDRRDLQISDVVHKAYVDVTEEGTEAAAATGTSMVLVAMQPTPPELVFRADHPFVFFIRDTRSGLILFTGRLLDPKR